MAQRKNDEKDASRPAIHGITQASVRVCAGGLEVRRTCGERENPDCDAPRRIRNCNQLDSRKANLINVDLLEAAHAAEGRKQVARLFFYGG